MSNHRLTILLFCAMFAAHLTWRAGRTLGAQHRDDVPFLYSGLGVLGRFFVNGLPLTATLSVAISVVWGWLHTPWYFSVILFIVAGLSFGVLHGFLMRFVHYRIYFVGLGPLIGTLLLVVTQTALWLS